MGLTPGVLLTVALAATVARTLVALRFSPGPRSSVTTRLRLRTGTRFQQPPSCWRLGSLSENSPSPARLSRPRVGGDRAPAVAHCTSSEPLLDQSVGDRQ
jgi:hypothetical protein